MQIFYNHENICSYRKKRLSPQRLMKNVKFKIFHFTDTTVWLEKRKLSNLQIFKIFPIH